MHTCSMCTMGVRNAHAVGTESPATGFADCCEPQHGCWELNSGPMQEQALLFITSQFSIPFCFIFILQMLNTHSPPKIGAQ